LKPKNKIRSNKRINPDYIIEENNDDEDYNETSNKSKQSTSKKSRKI
jgi:hypothetical protein